MLEFEFMRRALLAGFMLSLMLPLVGVVVVNRKTSMIGDALSHTSMAGVAIGLIAGINPTIGAIIICIISAFAIESVRKKFPQYGDLATAVVLSLGLGIAAVLQNFAPGGNSFESYLFGSISSVTGQDLILTAICFLAVIFISVKYYAALLDIAISPNLARLAGVNVGFINNIFTLFTAITIALACKVVGLLLVSSLLVLPVATSLIVAKSYKQSVLPHGKNYIAIYGENKTHDDPTDVSDSLVTSSHGMHIAGTIAANDTTEDIEKRNGIDGIAPNAQLLVYKIYDSANTKAFVELSSHMIVVLEDAVKHGADIITLSYGMQGMGGPSSAWYDAVRAATEKGVLVLGAMGNAAASTSTSSYDNYSSKGFRQDGSVWDQADTALVDSVPAMDFAMGVGAARSSTRTERSIK